MVIIALKEVGEEGRGGGATNDQLASGLGTYCTPSQQESRLALSELSSLSPNSPTQYRERAKR